MAERLVSMLDSSLKLGCWAPAEVDLVKIQHACASSALCIVAASNSCVDSHELMSHILKSVKKWACTASFEKRLLLEESRAVFEQIFC
jgi:hypothetical protein